MVAAGTAARTGTPVRRTARQNGAAPIARAVAGRLHTAIRPCHTQISRLPRVTVARPASWQLSHVRKDPYSIRKDQRLVCLLASAVEGRPRPPPQSNVPKPLAVAPRVGLPPDRRPSRLRTGTALNTVGLPICILTRRDRKKRPASPIRLSGLPP